MSGWYVGPVFRFLEAASQLQRIHMVQRIHMAKPNYAFAKRQRDLVKKRNKEETRLRKVARTAEAPLQPADSAVADMDPTAPGGKRPAALE